MTITEIKLELIDDNPHQRRQSYKEIDELGRIIAIDGLQQMPKARKVGDRYQLKFGHRRKRAFEWLRANWKKENLPERYSGYTVMPLEIETLDDEQMFRGVTIENSHRESLSPIEKMEEMKKWQEFGYTSEKIAALYPGMNASTVRGFLYLDKLPAKAKQMLDDGEITQGTARLLLSVQRLMSEADMLDLLKLLKEGVDGDGEAVMPDEIIVRFIDNLDNVEDMWNDRSDGKPRSHWRNGWLLGMKNFPNKMLAAMTAEDFVKVFQLTEKHQRVWNCITTAKDAAALVGMWETSDFEDDHPRAKTLAHLINPPACTACDYYAKVQKTHYCGLKACFERKTVAWHREILRAASKDLGIEIYQEADGKYVVLESHSSACNTLFKKRHADLRLIARDQITTRGYYSQYGFTGVNTDVFMVIAIGESATQLASKQTVKGTAVDRVAQRKNKLLVERKKMLLWDLTDACKTLFTGVVKGALVHLNEWHYLGVDRRPINVPEAEEDEGDMNVDTLSRMLVWRLLEDQISFEDRGQNCVKFLDQAHDAIAEFGLKPIKPLIALARQFDDEIKAVSAETLRAAKGGKK